MIVFTKNLVGGLVETEPLKKSSKNYSQQI
jgi:hypothetical protein